MANPAGKSNDGGLKLDFDRRLMLQFRGSMVTSDAGLLAYRELDDALDLTRMATERLAVARAGRNDRHALVGMLRQSVFGRPGGYEDVNAERLRHDLAMRSMSAGKRLRLRQLRRARRRAGDERLERPLRLQPRMGGARSNGRENGQTSP
jgi:hypothetical protein